MSAAGSKPIDCGAGSRSTRSVVNACAPAASTSSTSDFDIWIGRSASIANGRPPCSWAMIASYVERHLGVEAAGEHPLVLVHQLVGDADVAAAARLGSSAT